jgi:hypothetical protein
MVGRSQTGRLGEASLPRFRKFRVVGGFQTTQPNRAQSCLIVPNRFIFHVRRTDMFNAKSPRREGAKRKAEIGKAESRNALLLCVFAVLFTKTLHFAQSFPRSVFSVCSCSCCLVAACRAATWRLCVEKSSLSVKSGKSVVPFLRLRLAALGILWLLAGIQRKCLSMNNLQLKSSFANQGQSRLIKPNRVIFMRGNGIHPGIWLWRLWNFRRQLALLF